MSLGSVVCCQVEVSALRRFLVQRSPTECVVSECYREASIRRRPGPLGAVMPWKIKFTSPTLAYITINLLYLTSVNKKNVSFRFPPCIMMITFISRLMHQYTNLDVKIYVV
jgi:hypothetical protein